MLEFLHGAIAWLQSWMTPGVGLTGLFVSALLSATILPGSSEVVLSALIAAHPELAWPGFAVALAGNLCGCLITFGMGHAARQGYERFQRVQIDLEHPRIQRLRRWGPPALVMSFLPLVGDALVLAAGWLKLRFWESLAWIALGKGLRYLLLVLSVQGILSFT
jgi:membrane protein YqaA with SNARE-associated domain